MNKQTAFDGLSAWSVVSGATWITVSAVADRAERFHACRTKHVCRTADSKVKCNPRISVNESGVLRAVHEQFVVDRKR